MQPPPSWAELNSRLEALLGRLETPCSEQESEVLQDECQEWHQAADAVSKAAAVAPVGPSSTEREVLARWVGVSHGAPLLPMTRHNCT